MAAVILKLSTDDAELLVLALREGMLNHKAPAQYIALESLAEIVEDAIEEAKEEEGE